MRFEKIKYDPKTKTVTLRYADRGEHHDVECRDAPTPAFLAARKATKARGSRATAR